MLRCRFRPDDQILTPRHKSGDSQIPKTPPNGVRVSVSADFPEMDPEIQKQIESAVLDILRNADMEQMTEYKVRAAAAEKLGLDLSKPDYKRFVRGVVESFLLASKDKEAAAQGDGEEEEDEEEDKSSRGDDGKEYDDDGDLIICRLSKKRRVTIQDFRGKTLVSIREYYDRDGKELPSAKGISLTTEQWAAFRKSVPAIEEAIKKLESRLY